jgi:hypothetical protein
VFRLACNLMAPPYLVSTCCVGSWRCGSCHVQDSMGPGAAMWASALMHVWIRTCCHACRCMLCGCTRCPAVLLCCDASCCHAADALVCINHVFSPPQLEQQLYYLF